MTSCDKPLFLLSKGERKALETPTSVLAFNRLMHYRDIAAMRYIWDVPEGVPPEYPEHGIFDCGGLGAVRYEEQTVPIQGRPAYYGALQEVLRWTPVSARGYQEENLLKQRDSGTDPYVLIDRIPLSESLQHLCGVQAQAWETLNQCLIAMSQPIVVKSAAGGELRAIAAEQEIKQGAQVIKMLTGPSIDQAVLDLQGKDYTQNLISTINQLDQEILSILGVPALGTSKTSGITSEEAGSMASEMRITLERGLRMREYCCDILNDKADLDLSVRINEDLRIPGPSEQDRTDGLTDNQRTDQEEQDDERLRLLFMRGNAPAYPG